MSGHEVLFDAPGPRARRRMRVVNALAAVVLGAVAWFVLRALEAKGQLDGAKWRVFVDPDVWQYNVLPGLRGTLVAAAISIVLAIAFGLVFGLGRLSQVAVLRWVSGAVVEFFRAVPVLLMMIFLYLLLGRLRVVPSEQLSLVAVVIALTLYNGAVIAELVRSGVGNLPRGQREAGLAIGLREQATLRSILLPQALIAMLPSLVAQLVVILKDSALGYIIGYVELLRQARQIGTSNQNLIPAFIVVALLFILINYTLTFLAERVARRLRLRTAGSTRPEAPGAIRQENRVPLPTGDAPAARAGRT